MKNLIKKIVPKFIFSWYHFILAYLGALIYSFPSQKLIIIGVTGTKGKTTTCNLIAQILNGVGLKTGMATTVNFRIGEKEWINEYKQTMLGRFKLQKLLRQMNKEGCKYAVIETSSEGILQHRHCGIDYSVAVFTNLSPEHIEHHGSFDNYRAAKLKLFKKVAKKENGVGIYNLDDENVGHFLEVPIANKYGYVLKSEIRNQKSETNHKFQITNLKLTAHKTEFDFGTEHFEMPLIGEFNVYNAVAAICVALSQGVTMEKIKEILKNAKPTPGRLEVVDEGQPFTVIVDYAHEPASLEAVYKTLKIFNPRQIIAVLGAQGGGRDKTKRPILGKLAAQYADYIIVTNEDPYDENPQQIIDDVAAGVADESLRQARTFVRYSKIIDRREAIRKALSLAQREDIVIITGKGGEVWMCVENGKKIPWDERKIVEEEIKKLTFNQKSSAI